MRPGALRHLAALCALSLPLLAAAQDIGGPPPPGTAPPPPRAHTVPEPGSLLLAGLAIAGSALARRRRCRASELVKR